MSNEAGNGFVRVAAVDELAEGKPKAVRVEGHSIALFEHEGSIYATDNQCPHMGYPLTRGYVRNGVLTCDWHGFSYDMGGGGCFTGGCDDLDTYPVEVRDGGVYLDVHSGGSKRSDAHFLLLKEGLNNGDNWTLSKAIAILIARGVSEKETLNLIVSHMGRHIATDRGQEGGNDVAQLVNGVKVARRYPDEDRLIPLMMAASAAAGRAGDRAQVQPLPPPVSWERVADCVRFLSADKMAEGIEKCLITARGLGDHDDEILPLLFECAVQPYFIGQVDNLRNTVYLAELLEEFGWEVAQELVCNIAGKMLGRGRGVPMDVRREAIGLYESAEPTVQAAAARYDLSTASGTAAASDFDESALAQGLVSRDITSTFGAVTTALQQGATISQMATTMVLLAVDRMARTPVGMSPGWGDLSWEMTLASSLRTVERYAGFGVAARALYHVAWRFFDDRWLNIPRRDITEPLPTAASVGADEDAALAQIIDTIEAIRVREIGRGVREYLSSGFDGNRLMLELGLTILKDDDGQNLLHTLRTVFDEWTLCAQHPARNQLLVGLARWATDTRRRIGTRSAAQTAQRFARGETAVELYEQEGG